MDDANVLNTLIELVEKFLFVADTLFEKSIISQEVYSNITENKIKFLEVYKPSLKRS